ncbi:AAA family ATPase [Kitasatospora aburaviensis]
MVDVLLMVIGTLLGMATNYATGQTDHVPLPLRLLRDWSVPLIGVALVLLVGGQIALHLLDRPAPVRRMWDRAQPPYPGLEAFTEGDAAVFFGRDREIADLVGRLHPAAPRRAQRFVTVVGPSGSGKSSLVRAGLLPALARRRGRWAVAAPFSPGWTRSAPCDSGWPDCRPNDPRCSSSTNWRSCSPCPGPRSATRSSPPYGRAAP